MGVRMRMSVGRLGCLAVLMAAALPLGACSTAKYKDMPADLAAKRMEADVQSGKVGGSILSGLTGNEVDLTESLEEAQAKADAESKSAAVPERALNEMADEVAQWLVLELPEPDYKAGLIVGRLQGAENDPDLQHVLDTLAIMLYENETFSSRFAILTSTRSEAEDLVEQFSGDWRDYVSATGEDLADTEVQRLHPDDLYVLTGNLRRTKEGLVLHVSANVRVEKARELGRIVAAEPFRRSYYLHPTTLEFESKAQNDQAWDAWRSSHPKDDVEREIWWD